MTAQTGLFVAQDAGGNGTTPRGARQALAGLLAKNADGTVKTGVLADGQGPVVTGAAGMTYNVRKHVAVTKATEANGPVLVPNDGTVSVSTDPAPGSNSRIDIIYVQQRLVSGDGGSETTVAPLIGVAIGTAEASPTAPTGSMPPGALELARVPVPAGTTATSALTFTQGATTRPVGTVSATGKVTSTAPGVDFASPVTHNIVFPAGLFTVVPTPAFSVSQSGARCRITVQSITTSGMTAVAFNTSTNNATGFDFYWTATQA